MFLAKQFTVETSAKSFIHSTSSNVNEDMNGVKEEMLNVGQDVTEMARNLKKQM